MRLLNYLALSGLDEDTNTFRTLTVMLVDKSSPYLSIISEIADKHNIGNLPLITESLNKELKNVYRGKYFFDFCVDEGVEMDKLKLRKKYYQKLKILQLEANDALTTYKKQVENALLLSKQ